MRLIRRHAATATVALAGLTFTSATIGLATPANAIVGGSIITTGELADSGPFGWLVRLEGGGGRCTGSLVDSQYVLTAAHCVDIDDGSGITAFLGDSDAGIAVAAAEQNPGFDGGSDADLAMMRLADSVSRPPVALTGTTDALEVGTEVRIAGWGAVDINGGAPTEPRTGGSVATQLLPNIVVTGGPDIACSGDSGGPVLHDGVLVAVMSSSDQQCATTTVSTRVAAHRAWISSFIGADNQPPTATGGTITAAVGEPVEITLAFSDPDSDTAFISGADIDENVWNTEALSCVDQPGALVCTFTPLFPFVGTTEVTYSVRDEQGATSTATWVITFEPTATAPVADDAFFNVVAGRTTELALVASDANGDPISFAVDAPPLHGSLAGCSTGTCTYTPGVGYTGSDAFTFTATDDGGLVSNVATVNIEVVPNAAPEAFDFTVEVTKNTATGIALQGADPTDDELVYTIVDDPTNGTLDCSAGGCTYTPDVDYEGADSFTYSATDIEGLESNLATVSVEVVGNSTPIVEDVTAQTKKGLTAVVTLNAFDIENDTVTFAVERLPEYGTVDVDSCETGQCRYTPDAGFSGVDTFTWTASDEFGASAPALATIEVVASTWDVTPLDSAAAAIELAAAVLDGDLTGTGSFSGVPAAAGTFSGAADVIGIDAGIVLSSGLAVDVVGPNFDDARSTVHATPGDDALFPGIGSTDAVMLRYEVTPGSNQLRFRYVLASEEYGDGGYVTAGFDDTAIISVGDQRCGLPGDTATLPIAVSSIRNGVFDDESFQPVDDPVNAGLFVDNRFGTAVYDTEMDGFSAVLECAVDVVVGQPVVVTIAVADGGDGSIDTALLVEGDVSVDVVDLLDELLSLTDGLANATSLMAKIDRMTAAVEAGRTASACGSSKAFANEVRALSGHRIPTATAEALVATAQRVAATIGCS